MKKKKVLCLFDYFARTGFGTVSKNIVKELKKNFGSGLELDIIAINYFGKPYQEDENTFIISGRMNDVKDDFYGRHVFLKCLMDGDYDGVFICQDLGVIVPIIEIIDFIKSEKKDKNRKLFKSIFYFPVDCNIVYELTKNLELIDVLVTYTEYGRKEVLKHKPNLKIKVVPHGNNSKDFYPLPEQEIKQFRKEYFGCGDEKFVVTNINRNQPRKDLPQTIFGFIEAKKQWKQEYSFLPEPFLYLHCHPNDPYGWDLRAVLMQTDLVEDIDYKLLPKDFEEMMADNEIVNKIYNGTDVFLTTTLGEGWGLCLAPSSMILKNDGCSKIKDIKIGDQVMTNSGEFNKVLDTTCRKVDSYIKVKTKYGYEIKATHEHPYYSLLKNNTEERWRKISELKKGDYLAIVKPKEALINLEIGIRNNYLDLCDYLNLNEWCYDHNHISHKYGYSPSNKRWSISTICNEYSTTKKVVENAIAFIIGKKEKVSETVYRLANNLIANGFDKPQPLKINRIISITDELLWVFGWYLAEGSCEAGKRLEFSMGKDEVKEAKKIAKIISEYFGIKDVKVRVFKNKCAVRVSSVALANIFKSLFGNGAYNKRIPDILFREPKKLIPLVKGYIEGDGHINLSNNHISFSTVSPSLAYQVQSVLAANNIMLSVKYNKTDLGNYDRIHCQIPRHHIRRYMELVGMEGVLDRESKRNHKPDFIETDTHFFVPIISIQEIKEDIEVYDLCVEKSHSFIANGIVCHNTFSEAASCKIPLIAPYSTSFMEMSAYGKNAYMLYTLVPFCSTFDNVIREQTDIYEISDKIIEVAMSKFSKNEDLKNRINRSYDWVKKLEWSEVCKSWVKYFKETF